MLGEHGSFGRGGYARRAVAACLATLTLLSVVVVASGSAALTPARTLWVAVVLYEDDLDRAPVSAGSSSWSTMVGAGSRRTTARSRAGSPNPTP